MRYQFLFLSLFLEGLRSESDAQFNENSFRELFIPGIARNYRNLVTWLIGRIIGVTAETRGPRILTVALKRFTCSGYIDGRDPTKGGFDTLWKGDLRTRGGPAIIRDCRFIRGIWQAGRISITRPKLVSRVVARSLPSATSRILSVPRVVPSSFPPLPNRVNEKYRCSNAVCTYYIPYFRDSRFNNRFSDQFGFSKSIFS